MLSFNPFIMHDLVMVMGMGYRLSAGFDLFLAREYAFFTVNGVSYGYGLSFTNKCYLYRYSLHHCSHSFKT